MSDLKLTPEQRDYLVEHFKNLFNDPSPDILKTHYMCIEGIIQILNQCTEDKNEQCNIN